MNDLVEFACRVKDVLMRANREPHWEAGEAERYMAAMEVRRENFVQLATRLNDSIMQPRLQILISYFPNACLMNDEPPGHCVSRFGYSERFPATTKVAFAVEHDVRYEKAIVCYEAAMMPVFVKLNERDRLTLPIDNVPDDVVANWVEQRLMEFLDTYLRIDRGTDDFEDEPATDPVCGMRISRSTAAASDSHRGHPYFFCSKECQERFARKPTAYVEVKSL